MNRDRGFFDVKSLREKASDSYWSLILVGLYSAALIVSCFQLWEDYQANLAVMYMDQTAVATGDAIIQAMAFFIQLAPIWFAFAYIRDSDESSKRRKIMSALFWGSLFVDLGLGSFFRSNGWSLGLYWNIWAIVKDFVFFTVGSEMMFTFSLSMVMYSVPIAFEYITKLFDRVIGLLKDEKDDKKVQRKDDKRHNPPQYPGKQEGKGRPDKELERMIAQHGKPGMPSDAPGNHRRYIPKDIEPDEDF